MKKIGRKIFYALIFVFGLFSLINSSADTSGIFVGNETFVKTNTSAEMDVIINIEATQSWAEVEINTSEIIFGNVVTMSPWNTYRAKYKIKARGNINIDVIPTLSNQNDEIFSNLYFARTYETSKSKWTQIGQYRIRFNLTENEGYWSTIGPSGLINATWSGTNGDQSILLDLSNYTKPIPFSLENYRGNIKFRIIPAW